jgi:hypothetical protein
MLLSEHVTLTVIMWSQDRYFADLYFYKPVGDTQRWLREMAE